MVVRSADPFTILKRALADFRMIPTRCQCRSAVALASADLACGRRHVAVGCSLSGCAELVALLMWSDAKTICAGGSHGKRACTAQTGLPLAALQAAGSARSRLDSEVTRVRAHRSRPMFDGSMICSNL
jgi:hypothetical protein